MTNAERNHLPEPVARAFELGWSVIPVAATKHPLVKWRPFQEKRATRVQLETWAVDFPRASWAVVCGQVSGVVVLDFDGPEGEATRATLGLEPNVTTPGGGSHVYVEAPPHRLVGGARVGGRQLPGLDLRSDGQLAILFGTRGEGAYERQTGSRVRAVQELPATVRRLLDARRYREPIAPQLSEDFSDFVTPNELVQTAAEQVRAGTTRNAAGFVLACGLRDERVDFDAAQQSMAEFARAVHDTGSHKYTETEAYNSLVSAYSWPPRAPAKLQRGTGHDAFRHTDMGNAERLIALHGEDLRYCADLKAWLVWDDERWVVDRSHRVDHLAKRTVREIYKAVANENDDDKRKRLEAHARRSEDATRIAKMVRLAQSEPAIQVHPGDLDADDWKINLINGTLDLRTGELMAHDRHDLITKLAPVSFDATADAPTWRRVLEEVIPDEATRDALQSAVGYSLTGDVSAHALFLLYGTGANGKTLFLNTLTSMLGDYAQQAPSDVLLRRRAGGSSNDVARLKGSRFVAASETEQGGRLAETVVKQLTGGDRVVARFLYGEFFEFAPTFKFWIATNNRPRVTETNDAIWRRLRLVPFTVTIPPERRIKNLDQILRAELPGILNWALAGARDFAATGELRSSDQITEATSKYRTEEDLFGRFLNERCVVRPRASITAAALYVEYEVWCTTEGVQHKWAKNRVGRELRARGFRSRDVGRAKTATWYGIDLAGGTA